MDLGSWIEQGKSLTETFTKAKDALDNPKVKAGLSDQKVNHHLRQVENRLEDEVSADDINISASVKSELGEFIQKGLVAMGHNITVDGQAGAGTVAALNAALMDKVDSVSWHDMDKLKDVKEIDDITQLTGRHVQVLIDELRDRDVLGADTPEMLVDLGQALRDVDNKDLQELADKFDPKIEAPAQELGTAPDLAIPAR